MRTLVVVVALAATAACKKVKRPPPAEGGSAAPATALADDTPRPLPPGANGGAIGPATPDAPVQFIDAAADASWVMLCQKQGDAQRLAVVVADRAPLMADRALAWTDTDVVVVAGAQLVHVDVVAKTWRALGPLGPAAIDPGSRRIVHGDGAALVVRDHGAAPRRLAGSGNVAGLRLRGARWAELAIDSTARELRTGACGAVFMTPQRFRVDQRATIDLDPSGVEAADRVGPELGITAAGEVTLDGAVVVDAACVANVYAALATPPRALVTCSHGASRVVGPGGTVATVNAYSRSSDQSAQIIDDLILGQRVVCLIGACVDLVTGRGYDISGAIDPLVYDDRLLARTSPTGVVIDRLDDATVDHREVTLPRLAAAVVVDTATGRRRAATAPAKPQFIDRAGSYLLYGRYVIDLDQAKLAATLTDDAVAVDRTGRVLVADPAGTPFRWQRSGSH